MADEDNSCNKVELTEIGSKACYFYALGGFKYKQKGDRIHYNDQIILKNTKLNLYLHVSERLLKIDCLDGQVPDSLVEGVDLITPKKIDRREPPNQYSPHYEVNTSNIKSKFTVLIMRYFDEDLDSQFIKGGMVVRLLHSELGGFLHSDDTDFNDNGLAEVYMWNFKGKTTDLEATSSSSLFEIEFASKKDSGSKSKLHTEIKRQDPNKRTGQVFRYSKLPLDGGSCNHNVVNKQEDFEYRLRHLNTGRLVIDQEIEYKGKKIRTLGLSDHCCIRDLAYFSDKGFDSLQQEIEMLDRASAFRINESEDNNCP